MCSSCSSPHLAPAFVMSKVSPAIVMFASSTSPVLNKLASVFSRSVNYFGSLRPENTVEALRDLVKRDNQHPLPGLAYVEFDIHVSRTRCQTPAQLTTQLTFLGKLCP